MIQKKEFDGIPLEIQFPASAAQEAMGGLGIDGSSHSWRPSAVAEEGSRENHLC
jgi:hypothetical protein